MGARDKATWFLPKGALRGSLRVPADKSISHRAAIISSICDQPVEIGNFLRADDTMASLRAVAACGIRVENLEDGDPVIHGAGLRGLRQPGSDIDVGNSGTTIRLLSGVFAGQSGVFVLDGDESIRKRPMDRIAIPLRKMGVDIKARDDKYAPLQISGGPVTPISYNMPVASAQVKSSIMLAALYASGPTEVIEPAVCRDHTEIMLMNAGANVERDGLVTTIYPPGHLRLERVDVPADISSAAFLLVAATIVPGSEITLPGVGINPTRTGLLDILKDMGANISIENERLQAGEPVADLTARSAKLKSTRVGGGISGRTIDELPLVALAAAFARGETHVSGAAELRLKESDRIEGLVRNLRAIGVDIEARQDGFIIRGRGRLQGGDFESLGDHRMAMLGAIAGMASSKGVAVTGFDCVSVSFPGFALKLLNLIERDK